MPDIESPVAPYATLGPDTVLDALYLAGLEPDGRLLQLNSYENRVYQANLEGGRVVVAKFYRPARWSGAQILEEHAFSAELAVGDLPVVSPFDLAPAVLDAIAPGNTLGHFASPTGERFRFAVCERRVGRAPELEHPETQAWLGRLIGRMHAVGAHGRFEHRRRLDVETFGRAPRQRLIEAGFMRPESEGAWLSASAHALDEIEAAFARHDGLRTLRLHGDCHPGNVLWREEGEFAGPNFVDFDDCCTGPAIQDLWMLLPGERGAVDASLHHLLDGYRDFMNFDDRELLLIEPLRTLRMLHHSAWLAERWSDPAFPVAFPWFGSPNYWQQQTTELREQIERMQDR